VPNINPKSKARIDLTSSRLSSLKKVGVSNNERPVRVINIDIWDSYLVYENYSFTKPPFLVNPRNPFQLSKNQDK